jgi:hypothetical protein
VKQREIEVKPYFEPYSVVEPKRVRKTAWYNLRSGRDHPTSMRGSVEIFVYVTLKIGLDELTNWFKMSHVTSPVELNENIQYFTLQNTLIIYLFFLIHL